MRYQYKREPLMGDDIKFDGQPADVEESVLRSNTTDIMLDHPNGRPVLTTGRVR